MLEREPPIGTVEAYDGPYTVLGVVAAVGPQRARLVTLLPP